MKIRNILNFHSELDQTWNFKSLFYVENISLTKQNEQRIDRNDVFFISFAKKKKIIKRTVFLYKF